MNDGIADLPPMEAATLQKPAGAARIAVLLHDFNAGGAERNAIRLANAWAIRGRNVVLLAGHASGPLRTMVDPAVQIVSVAFEVPRGPGSRRRLAPTMAQLIIDQRPDLLFVPGNYHFSMLYPLLALPRSSRPAIVVKLSNLIRRDDRRGLRRWLYEARLRRGLSRVDAIIAMSPMLADEARAVIRHRQISVIKQPTLPDHDGPALPRTAGPQSRRLLAIGRLVPQKNFLLLVEAFALLRDNTLDLTILGDGPEREAIESAARRLGIADRVHLPGYTQDIRPHLEHARMLLLSSHFEGFPAVVVEALAAGLPVVATDCSPAIAELIGTPEHGAIVATGQAQALADAITQQLLKASPDASRLTASVAHHRIGPIASEYLALFDRVAGSRVRA